jgi:hypothetical protein
MPEVSIGGISVRLPLVHLLRLSVSISFIVACSTVKNSMATEIDRSREQRTAGAAKEQQTPCTQLFLAIFNETNPVARIKKSLENLEWWRLLRRTLDPLLHWYLVTKNDSGVVRRLLDAVVVS